MESLSAKLEQLSIVKSKKNVGVIYDPKMTLHSTSSNHPERPERLTSIVEHLKITNLLSQCDLISAAKLAEISTISLIHSEHYVNHVENLCKKWKPSLTKRADTYYNKETNISASLAVDAVCQCVDKVCTSNWNSAFAIVRPPGHHANMEDASLSGFCIYNNVAIAAKYAQKQYGVDRILIFDWDIHHGDSTQKFSYDDKSILYASIHRYDQSNFYPGDSGDIKNIGTKTSLHYNINVPWNIEESDEITVGDNEYIYIFERILMPIFLEFQPELVFISAGFDSAWGDYVGNISLSPNGYSYMTERLITLAKGKVIVALEGGYNLKSISISAEYTLRALLGQSIFTKTNGEKVELEYLKNKCRPNTLALNIVDQFIQLHSKKWKSLLLKELIEYDKLVIDDTYNETQILKNSILKENEIYCSVEKCEPLALSLNDQLNHDIKNYILPFICEKEYERKKYKVFQNPLKDMNDGSYWSFTLSIEDHDGNQNVPIITTHKFVNKDKKAKIVKFWDEDHNFDWNYKFVLNETSSHFRYFMKKIVLSNGLSHANRKTIDSFNEFLKILINFLASEKNKFFNKLKLLLIVDNISKISNAILLEVECKEKINLVKSSRKKSEHNSEMINSLTKMQEIIKSINK